MAAKIQKLRTAISSSVFIPMRTCSILFVALITVSLTAHAAWSQSYSAVSETVQPKMVKIYGSGGLRGLEAYQSGFLITSEGHILTAWSYVLDSEEYLFVVTGDGQKYGAKLINHDPRLEIALLKIEAEDLPFFNMDDVVELQPGARVLAFSNLFGIAAGDEPASIQHGHVMAVTDLAARRGAFQTIYRGPVYVVDAMTNNPGAAGGVLTDTQGRLSRNPRQGIAKRVGQHVAQLRRANQGPEHVGGRHAGWQKSPPPHRRRSQATGESPHGARPGHSAGSRRIGKNASLRRQRSTGFSRR